MFYKQLPKCPFWFVFVWVLAVNVSTMIDNILCTPLSIMHYTYMHTFQTHKLSVNRIIPPKFGSLHGLFVCPFVPICVLNMHKKLNIIMLLNFINYYYLMLYFFPSVKKKCPHFSFSLNCSQTTKDFSKSSWSWGTTVDEAFVILNLIFHISICIF